jgi:hypothetical protein
MITKLTKHDSHKIEIFQTQNNFTHSYALRCCDCNKHIQWLSVKDVEILKQFGIKQAEEKYVTGEIQ